MFLVITRSPVDEGWEERKDLLYEKAGRKSDSNVMSYEKGVDQSTACCHVWFVATMQDAQRLVKELSKVPMVQATMRER